MLFVSTGLSLSPTTKDTYAELGFGRNHLLSPVRVRMGFPRTIGLDETTGAVVMGSLGIMPLDSVLGTVSADSSVD